MARSHGFSDIAEPLADLVRPGLRLVYHEEPPTLGTSKLGGRPDLPPDLPWPHREGGRDEPEPMTFFGQIALADLDPHVWPGPRDGLMSFFCRQAPDYYGVDFSGAARVLHVPSSAALRPRDAPSELDEDFRLDEAAVALHPEITLPTIGAVGADVLSPFDFQQPRFREQRAYWALEDDLAAAQGFAGNERTGRPPVHRLLGWPRHLHDDVMVEIVLSHFQDNDLPDATGDLRHHVLDWRLLLQIDADRRLGASFGDGGTLFFGIPARDLPDGRLDRVQAASQCN